MKIRTVTITKSGYCTVSSGRFFYQGLNIWHWPVTDYCGRYAPTCGPDCIVRVFSKTYLSKHGKLPRFPLDCSTELSKLHRALEVRLEVDFHHLQNFCDCLIKNIIPAHTYGIHTNSMLILMEYDTIRTACTVCTTL